MVTRLDVRLQKAMQEHPQRVRNQDAHERQAALPSERVRGASGRGHKARQENEAPRRDIRH
uniref:Uncharacterized protein n=1 Tax=Kalanchoe fedtschenkoi TaxID=63787 RepID=A0A7N0UML8_KALFE